MSVVSPAGFCLQRVRAPCVDCCKSVGGQLTSSAMTSQTLSCRAADRAGEAGARNIPALAWSLVSTPSNAERLDGFAFQKLSKQRCVCMQRLLVSMHQHSMGGSTCCSHSKSTGSLVCGLLRGACSLGLRLHQHNGEQALAGMMC